MLKLPDWWSRGRTQPPVSDEIETLDAFGSERLDAADWKAGRGSPFLSKIRLQHLRIPLGLGILITAVAVSGYFVQKWRLLNVEAASASLTIESNPAGAEVFADGVTRGATPLTLSIAPGEHVFELVHEGRRKSLRTLARSGVSVVHHVQFEPHPPPVPTTGALIVETDPPGLRVFVNGKFRGGSPVTTSDLEPGAQRVQVMQKTGTMLERNVDVRAGESTSVIISAAVPSASGSAAPPAPRATPAGPAGPAAGWLTVESPIVWQVFEGKDLIGTSQSSKILLAAGKHELQLTNEPLGLSERRTVQVKVGTIATMRVDVPIVPLNINANPWAEAWVDGKRVGETPIGKYRVTVGTHEVLFRHPVFGERRKTITVSAKGPARVSVDMRKPQ